MRTFRSGSAVRLLLFDIDGTLVLTGGAGKVAMAEAIVEVFGIAEPLEHVALAGRTDRAILEDALEAAPGGPVPLDGRLASFQRAYFTRLAAEMDVPRPHKRALPGVRDLLDRLSGRDDVALGLLTGNFAESARLKLEHFDLWRYFAWGAYGGDTRDRNTLVPVALQCALDHGCPAVEDPASVVVIGDTPHDVACARSAKATAVAVATGYFSVDQLRATGADVVLPDLSETERVVALLTGRAA
jgi:phosphoglycolate phosphatase